MAVSLILLQTRSVVNNLYRVDNSVPTALGIEPQVFVKNEETYEYDRVATLTDMMTLGTTPDPRAGYYRDLAFYRDFEDVSTASSFASGIKDRVALLVEAYDDAVNTFIGSDSNEYESI